LAYKVDYAALRLSILASKHSVVFRDEGSKEFRIKMGIDKKAAKKLVNKQLVLEEYYRIETTELRPHRIASIIRNRIEKKGKKPPSIQTIKNYLEEEGEF